MANKVLIYRRGGLGDTLLTFPLAEIFKRKGFEVDFVGNTDYLSLAKLVGFTDGVFSELPPDLRGYERIILISAYRFLDLPNVVWVSPFPTERVHITLHYLKSLGLESEPFSLELSIPPLKGWEGRAVIHPGSGSPKKNAPLEFFKELYTLLEEKGYSPLFALGEAEHHLEEELREFETYRVEDLVEFARLLKRAKLFIGNDSGFSHLAGYLGVKTIVLFGPTDPMVWKPLGKRVKVVYKSLSCSPCFPRVCSHKECLNFSSQEVVKVLD
ncbi:MAG: lipopolysaccharide heptosyltransferase family protein [Aquificaceae bacterium]|nr:MAG: lipopolysaccharide heptosyltransferase family protein [Aquificaceae bacterium]